MAHYLIAGGFGFIGTRLGIFLTSQGHQVSVITRTPSKYAKVRPYPCEILAWNDPLEKLAATIEQSEAIINLCGDGIVDKDWSYSQKENLLSSRIQPIQALRKACVHAQKQPKCWIQASAIGIYGTSCPQPTTEEAPLPNDFLSTLCQQWEQAAKENVPPQTRLILLRIGIVLGEEGGFLAKMTPLYASSLGARLGSGKQKLSFIHIDDLVALICTGLQNEQLHGFVNACAPHPCTGLEFHQAMQKFFGRLQAPIGVPKTAISLVMGERTDLIFADQNILPQKAEQTGFTWSAPTIEAALAKVYTPIPYPTYGLILRDHTFLNAPVEEVWPFFSDAKNLEKITPPWLKFNVLKQSTPNITENTLIHYKLQLRGIPFRWITRITDWQPGECFADTQAKGPYALWYHQHFFIPAGQQTIMVDRVVYRLPFQPLRGPLIGWYVKGDVEKIFTYRKQQIHRIYNTKENSRF